jgi:beta-glucosidase
MLRADGSNHLPVMAQLQAAGIPVVAVFLSGRPLWVNRELNASQAFVAAWLPGSEGAGVADVLFRKPSGGIAHDFRGKLSFSWPRRADQYGLLEGQAGYDPLFAFGFGLTYRDRRELPQLPEVSGIGTAGVR